MAKRATKYKNNTLRWMAKNAIAKSKSDWSQVRSERPSVAKNLMTAGKNVVNAEKKTFVDNPINTATAVGNFVFWSPETNEQYGDRWNFQYNSGTDLIKSWRWWGNVPTQTQQTPTIQTPAQWATGWPTFNSVWWATPVSGNAQWWATWTPTQTQQAAAQTPAVWSMNANVNFSQYGDDSSPENQWTKWWLNEKYTGEWVNTSNVEYDPNITTADLDPNYLYGMDAQNENAKNAWYIARRNDMIASALFNEWLTTREDIAQFLAQQEWWNNSTEEDRANTVESIYKRMWGIDTGEEEWEPMNYTDQVMSIMWKDLEQDTSWTLYGKTTADDGNPVNWITTLQDANSVFQSAIEWRMDMVKEIITQNPMDIANALAAWGNPYSDSTIRDLRTYAPEFWDEVQANVRKIQAWEVMDAITTGWELPNTTKTASDNVNNSVNTWAESISWWSQQQTSYNIANTSKAMAENQVANTATQEMLNIQAQIAEYEEKMNNLQNEANSVFKWDAPQYLVDAFMNSRKVKYQSEINKLQSRYQSALDLYKIELSNYQWGEEMKYKWAQYQQWVNKDNFDMYYKTQQLAMDKIKIIDWKAYMMNADGTMVQVADETAWNSYQQDVQTAINWYIATYTAWWWTPTGTWYKYGTKWWQCQQFTNNFTEAVTWLRMKWSLASDKVSYINERVPQVWDIAVAVWWVYDSYYWHTMLVTGYDPNTWIVDLLWSNNWWDETVYSTQAKLSDLYAKWLQGFWNPYADMIKQSVSSTWWYTENWVLVTPMTSKFDELIALGKDRKSIASAEQAYNAIYEMLNDGSLQTLITSWDMWKVWNFLSQTDFANTGEDEGLTFKNMLEQYLEKKAAREFSWWDKSISALRKLIELVESKLRNESWAVINSWEWKWDFQLFVPMPWESEELQWDKLWDWDNIIWKWMRVWWADKRSDYIPLFPKWWNRKTW